MYNNNINNHKDNIHNNNNNDIIYTLYKNIFNNKYLKNKIYNYVYLLNDEYLKLFYNNSNNNENDNNSDKYNNKCTSNKYFLNKVPFNIIFKSNNINLFKDRIKSNNLVCEENQFSLNLFLKFLKNYQNQISYQEILEFYKVNKDHHFSSIDHPDSDIIQLVINNNCLDLFKIIYQDQIQIFSVYKSKYNLSVKKKSKKSVLSSEANSKYFIYSNKILIMEAFLNSSVEFIKYLYDHVELDLFQVYDDILLWAIISENRLELVQYLLNDLDYFNNNSSNNSDNNRFINNDDIYNYLFLIDHKSFKKILKVYSNQINPPLILKKYYKIIQEHTNNNLNFNTQIDSILNLIHFNIIKTKSPESINIYNIIEQLIIYNQHQQQPQQQLDKIIDNIKQLNNDLINNNKKKNKKISKDKTKSKSKKSLFSFFISSSSSSNNSRNSCNSVSSSFTSDSDSTSSSSVSSSSSSSSSVTATTTINNYLFKGLEEFTNINFQNFNLEREVKRIYIFQFLNRKLINIENNQFNYFCSTLVYFSSKFKEFQIIDKFLKENSNRIEICRTVQYEIYKNIFIYGNSKLYQFRNSRRSTISNLPRNQFTISFCLIDNTNIQDFIDLLSQLNENNDEFFELLFFIITSYITTKDAADQAIQTVKGYYKQKSNNNFQLLDSRFLGNQFISIYFYKYYEDLFSYWDENSYLLFHNKALLKNHIIN